MDATDRVKGPGWIYDKANYPSPNTKQRNRWWDGTTMQNKLDWTTTRLECASVEMEWWMREYEGGSMRGEWEWEWEWEGEEVGGSRA